MELNNMTNNYKIDGYEMVICYTYIWKQEKKLENNATCFELFEKQKT